jgi:hypothetical protein
MSGLREVYYSYSHKVEEQIPIFNELKPLCQERQICLIRDENTLPSGERIIDFMNKLVQGKYIILVLSDAYFKSPRCMYELLHIYHRRSGKFDETIPQIVTDGCELFEDSYRLEIQKYWQEQADKKNKVIQDCDFLNVLDEVKCAALFRELSQKIHEIMTALAERKTLSLSELREKHYTTLLDPIAQKSQSPTQSPDDEKFLQDITHGIEADLKSISIFTQKIINENQSQMPVNATPSDLTNFLIKQCQAGEFPAVIKDMVYAFDFCWHASQQEQGRLLRTSKDLFRKLLLFNVRNSWLAEYRSTAGRAGFEIPEMESSGIDVVSSRYAQTLPCLKETSSGIQGVQCQFGKIFSLESGIQAKDVVPSITKAIAKVIWPKGLDASVNYTQDKLVKKINAHLKSRKTHKHYKHRQHYFVQVPIATDTQGTSLLLDSAVKTELRNLLPELGWITLSSGDCEAIFWIEDVDLDAQIIDFFRIIQEYEENLL